MRPNIPQLEGYGTDPWGKFRIRIRQSDTAPRGGIGTRDIVWNKLNLCMKIIKIQVSSDWQYKIVFSKKVQGCCYVKYSTSREHENTKSRSARFAITHTYRLECCHSCYCKYCRAMWGLLVSSAYCPETSFTSSQHTEDLLYLWAKSAWKHWNSAPFTNISKTASLLNCGTQIPVHMLSRRFLSRKEIKQIKKELVDAGFI